jgi:hypothetical protein
VRRFRVYVVGAATYLTIEHSAASAEELFSSTGQAGFLSAAAVERNGRRRKVVIPFGNIALIAEGEDQAPRTRQTLATVSRRLS